MTYVYPDDRKVWGADISFYQDDNDTPRGVDFQEMRDQGAAFVFIRAGQGTWRDSDFDANWLAAKEAGLPRSAYWFLDAREPGGAQAEMLRKVLGSEWGEMPPVVDYEHKVRTSGVTTKKGRTMSTWRYNTPSQLDEFIAKLGVDPMVYTSYYYWTDHGSRDSKYARLPLWIAGYGDTVQVPLPWREWDFWQFTDNGNGRAIGTESLHVDLNYTSWPVERLHGVPIPPPSPFAGRNSVLDEGIRALELLKEAEHE